MKVISTPAPPQIRSLSSATQRLNLRGCRGRNYVWGLVRASQAISSCRRRRRRGDGGLVMGLGLELDSICSFAAEEVIAMADAVKRGISNTHIGDRTSMGIGRRRSGSEG